jgi:hypothetical protein
VFAVYFNRNAEIANVNVNGPGPTDVAPVTMNIEQAHANFGHSNEEDARKTAKELGITLTRGTLCPCDACTVAKAKQKNMIKKSAHIAATKKDERRIFIDIFTVKKAKKGKDLARPNWYLMVDEKTQLKFSKFYPKKNDMIEPACAQLQKWKQAGLGVTHIRLDNAGENTKLQERAESAAWKLGVQFEYTARDTPQQNHLAELGFAILGNKGRACMVAANVPMTIRYKLFPKAFEYATDTDGLHVRKAIESMESNDSSGFKYGIPRAHSGATGEQGPKEGPMSEAKGVRFAVQERAESIGLPMRSK